MFCRNCGQQYVTDAAVICVKCGAQKGAGVNFCQNCGQQTPPNSMVCLNCGVALTSGIKGNKSKIAAGLFAIFLGCFGVHNFYLGYTGKAVTQLIVTILGLILTCIYIGAFMVVGISIWAFIEGIMIFTGKIDRDASGALLQD